MRRGWKPAELDEVQLDMLRRQERFLSIMMNQPVVLVAYQKAEPVVSPTVRLIRPERKVPRR